MLQETQEGAVTLNTEAIQAVEANVCLNANTVEGSSSLARMDEMGAVGMLFLYILFNLVENIYR